MPLFGAIFFGLVPALFSAWFLYWLDRYEKEPKLLLGGVFIWGLVIAAGGAFIINTVGGVGVYLFTESETTTDLVTGSIIAPIVEESLKGLVVLIVFLFARKEFDSILDGMIYGGVAALGFAATENAFYIYEKGYVQAGWEGFWVLVVIRVILVGWQHPFYTGLTGIGFALARMSRNSLVKFFAPLLGLFAAMIAHAFHNMVALLSDGGVDGLAFGIGLDWSGWLVMLIFVIFMIRREGRLLPKHLQAEVATGHMTAAQLRVVARPFGSFFSFLKGRATARFFQVCGELAHKKAQFESHGDEGGNMKVIESLRAELITLSPQVRF